LISSAVRVFGFDMAFQNCDRQSDNPNCLIHDGVVVAFDFERAFEFLGWRKGGEPISPLWPNMLWGARKHVLYRVAVKHRGKLDAFVNDLGALDSRAFDTATLLLPSDWSLHAKSIISHVQQIQVGLTTFRNNLLSLVTTP
jgi:hypothetical protein